MQENPGCNCATQAFANQMNNPLEENHHAR